MSEWSYVVGAYAVAWAGLLAYVVRLVVLNRRAGRRVGEVEGER